MITYRLEVTKVAQRDKNRSNCTQKPTQSIPFKILRFAPAFGEELSDEEASVHSVESASAHNASPGENVDAADADDALATVCAIALDTVRYKTVALLLEGRKHSTTTEQHHFLSIVAHAIYYFWRDRCCQPFSVCVCGVNCCWIVC